MYCVVPPRLQEVKIDGDSVAKKAGPSKLKVVNQFRCFWRRRCDGYEAAVADDGSLRVQDEKGQIVYKLETPEL